MRWTAALSKFMSLRQDTIAALRAQVDGLQKKIAKLEKQEGAPSRPFAFDAYPQRKIALLFSYEGWHYCGLAFQNAPTPLPTVEQKILEALSTARLVDGSLPPSAYAFSRCGRTDRGVSSSNQVISLWIRSALDQGALEGTVAIPAGSPLPQSTYEDASDDPYFSRHPPPAPSVANAASGPEHDYARILNRILPSSIRILAWSPVSERFDARFSCLGRQYKYFFSSTPSAPLDVDAMHDAAGRLLGEHDFRNFCKIDPSKQLTNFTRGVSHASIEALGAGSGGEQRYVFNLHGTAFLYHQVRCTMALLFLVGSGLEPASVISDLLDVDKVPCKPDYEMAHELPLLLWKCEFDAEALNWQKDRSGQDVMRSQLQEPAIQQTIREHHLQAQELLPASLNEAPANAPQSVAIQLGATSHTRVLKQTYTPLLKRPRGEHFATANERWLASKGDKRSRSTAAECDG